MGQVVTLTNIHLRRSIFGMVSLEHLPKALEILRREEGLSKAAASRRCDMYQQGWWKYESGGSRPELETLFRLVYGIGKTLADFEQVLFMLDEGLETQEIERRREMQRASELVRRTLGETGTGGDVDWEDQLRSLQEEVRKHAALIGRFLTERGPAI